MPSRPTWIDDVLRDVPPLATADEAMRCLRIKRRKLNQLITNRQLKPIRHREGGSSRLLVTRESLARYLRSLDVE